MPTQVFTVHDVQEWYDEEKNTAALLQSVIAHRQAFSLTGDDIWQLLRLVWVTAHNRQVTKDHWKRLKIPALAALFRTTFQLHDNVDATLRSMRLPKDVAKAAGKSTGIVNFYTRWRNSSLGWCRKNGVDLRRVIKQAAGLGSNDQLRFDLAACIEELPGVPSPGGFGLKARPATILTPLIACLDPYNRFPIMNARGDVQYLLRHLHLADKSLEDATKGLINLIGQRGIGDAFMIDVLADAIAEQADSFGPVKKKVRIILRPPAKGDSELPYFDEDERKAVIQSATRAYRRRHAVMTNEVKRRFAKLKPLRGTNPDCAYDILLKNYDGSERDLLIEVKPDTDKGSIRIAIGQLLDYRRFLDHRAGTDLALLTIGRPRDSYVEFLQELQISALWFTDESCKTLKGVGKAWKPLQKWK